MLQQLKRLVAGRDRGGPRVGRRHQVGDVLPLDRVVLDHQEGSGRHHFPGGCARRNRFHLQSVAAYPDEHLPPREIPRSAVLVRHRAPLRGPDEGQVDREDAAHGRLALQPGPAVLPAGRPVGLGERLEDRLLLFERDADPGVDDPEREDMRSAVEHFVRRAPTRRRHLGDEFDVALLRELEGVAQKVVENLLQALRVGRDRLRQARPQLDREGELGRFGDMAEGALEHGLQLGQRPGADVQGDGAGLDLG